MWNQKKQFYEMLGLSLVICRNKEGKYLVVKEKRNRGWWVAGGKVDPPESFPEAAIREAKEEGGIDIELKGILKVCYTIQDTYFQRVKFIFYSEPKDENQKPKDYADDESEEARWLSFEEIEDLQKKKECRGPELYEWAKYIEEGGIIYPLTLLGSEKESVKLVTKEAVKTREDLK